MFHNCASISAFRFIAKLRVCLVFVGSFFVSPMLLAAPSTPTNLDQAFPEKLSALNIYRRQGELLVPAAAYTVYGVRYPLFSDYAFKQRLVSRASASEVHWRDGIAVFPEGTILVKSFYYRKKGNWRLENNALYKDLDFDKVFEYSIDLNRNVMVETRVLAYKGGKWLPQVYKWNAQQTDASRQPAGDLVPFTMWDSSHASSFEYYIPEISDCAECHGGYSVDRSIAPLGWREWHIVFGQEGNDVAFKNSAQPNVRAYLDANCAYCHNPSGKARSSGLFLGVAVLDKTQLGLCKRPVAAGVAAGNGNYDIEPGNARRSIMVQRMQSTSPEKAMPEIGRSLVHQQAIHMVSDWINGLASVCPPQ